MIFRILFLTFIIVPIIEIYLLISVGQVIGVWNTIAVIIATAIIGAYLLKHQGLSTLARVQSTVAQGQLPAIELFEGIILIITGALLLTPGFFTDAIGFLGLIPFTRKVLVFWLIKRLNVTSTMAGTSSSYSARQTDTTKHQVIEGEYRREK